MSSFLEAIQWIIRFVILFIIGILIYKIYPINPFFVAVSASILFLLVLRFSEEKIEVNRDFLILTNYYCFNLFKKKNIIQIDKIKGVIVAGNLNLKKV